MIILETFLQEGIERCNLKNEYALYFLLKNIRATSTAYVWYALRKIIGGRSVVHEMQEKFQ